MGLSNEWTEWHLTPRGWESRSNRVDIANITEKPPPADRVLTCRYQEVQSSMYSAMETNVSELWRSSNEQLVASLLVTFGNCPRSL
jgi:hypothetical protein